MIKGKGFKNVESDVEISESFTSIDFWIRIQNAYLAFRSSNFPIRLRIAANACLQLFNQEESILLLQSTFFS